MNNSIYKIALYGDSLACPRQGIVKSEERYIALIDQHLRQAKAPGYLEIRDKAKGGATLEELLTIYYQDNGYFDLPANTLIIHTGIVDCAPRPIDDKLRRRINKLPNIIKNRVISYLHHNRAKLLLKNGGYVKTDLIKFARLLNSWLQDANKNFETIFVINICPTTEKMEAHSPGLTANINRYNAEINNVLSKINSTKIKLIDVNAFVKEKINEIGKYIVLEDGHHIHPATHQWIANQIIDKLT